jgi:hypothetical protein
MPRKKIDYQGIRKTLEQVLAKDQDLRLTSSDYAAMMQRDKENLVIVSSIIDSLGWIGKDKIGSTANVALFLVIQHSDKLTMEKYLPVMKKAVADGKASKSQLALLIDRVEVLNNRPQVYGSQGSVKNGIFILDSIVDIKNVELKRTEMGLDSLNHYVIQLKKLHDLK